MNTSNSSSRTGSSKSFWKKLTPLYYLALIAYALIAVVLSPRHTKVEDYLPSAPQEGKSE